MTAGANHYDFCPRAPDLEELHVAIALLQQAMDASAKQLAAHNGYIRDNQAFQNRLLGGMGVIGLMSGLGAAMGILARIG